MLELKNEPLNREPAVPGLISSFLTTKDGYDRNHGEIPHLDASTHRVKVDGAVAKSFTLSISSLRDDYPQHTVVCALQCAGNRRHTMRTQQSEVEGIDWSDGAVMNCKWRGPKLSDILSRAYPTLKTGHVAFACHASECEQDSWYGGSVPLSWAIDPGNDVLLALDMNDAPLTPKHGYPVRIVTPGIAGARAVKWVDTITIQENESQNFYQQRDYKILPPQATDKDKAEQYWDSTPALQEMPVNSVIAVPESDSEVSRTEGGLVEIQGYALPGGRNGPVVRVEVSANGGETWVEAELLHHPDQGKWSWVLWRAKLEIEKGAGRSVRSRATDQGGNTQNDDPQWNLRGCGYNGYGLAEKLHVI